MTPSNVILAAPLMFETVAPEKFAPRRSRRVYYETLPISIAFHAAIGAAVLVANVWTVTFPDESPAQVMSFSIAELPPPPPPPPPARALAQPTPVKVVQVQPAEIVAPTVIPDEIPVVEQAPLVAAVPDASTEGVEGGVPGGEIGGIFGGVHGGDKGGTFGGTIGGIVAEKNQIIIERDKPLPLYPMSQVYPNYPEEARLNSFEDRLVVRYVIGTNGRIKDVSVVVPPEREVFIDPTLRAIRSWRFRPLVKDGQKQEVVHELTVFYKLTQS